MNSSTETIVKQAADKQRIVVTGSRGTTTLTALLIHVLNYYKRPFDYSISVAAHGISETERLSSGGPLIIIEANEQNMLDFKHHIGLITNIMWTASEEFPTENDYVKRFDQFADSCPKAGILYYCENDPLALLVGAKPRTDVLNVGYKIHPHTSDAGNHFITSGKEKIPVNIFGSQNFQNISGAKELLKRVGITADQFYKALPSFPL
jgi:UDP-N-acetylmuramate: L-alanyl-gamma-D-glutamyl-meso-diaminopimelate ligase